MIDILIGVIVDFILGDPYSFPHPVKLMGRIISLEDKLARKISRSKKGLKTAGLFIVIINLSLGFLLPYYLLNLLRPYKTIFRLVNIYIIYSCLSARSLHYEAMKVSQALDQGLEEARHRLSYIVGRETDRLNEEEIIKATVETVAENTSDGVIAPLVFIILLGAPGGLAYKFINTMDSMLGYMNDKYIDLGYFPAKVDDLANYLPARLTGLVMNIGCLGSFNMKDGLKIMIRDRKNHKSPNAAYPEGAVAGLLGIELGGNSYYHGRLVEKLSLGDRLRPIERKDIRNTLEIMYRAEIVMLVLYILIHLAIRAA